MPPIQGTHTQRIACNQIALLSSIPQRERENAVEQGNTIRAMTRGVAAFTLLLSPDVVDFARPVTVVADGRTVFEGRVQKNVTTLLTWAARDNDRTMLYGAALPVRVP